MRPMYWILIGWLALLPMTAAAQTSYVTDTLRLRLFSGENATGDTIQVLVSGQEMEILSRDVNFANVRLPDGTIGWVKTAYLVDEKPARLIVSELTSERDVLSAELADTKASFAAPAATIDTLRNEMSQIDASLTTANNQIESLQAENASIQGLKEKYRGSLPLSWVAGAIGVCLIAGFLVGMWWVDRRSRQRHGGIRIY